MRCGEVTDVNGGLGSYIRALGPACYDTMASARSVYAKQKNNLQSGQILGNGMKFYHTTTNL